jgi:hypothetical protein
MLKALTTKRNKHEPYGLRFSLFKLPANYLLFNRAIAPAAATATAPVNTGCMAARV